MSMVMEEGQGQGQGSNSQSQNCNDVVVEHDGTNDISIEEEELALVALVEHRTREFKKIRFFVSHYTNQLEEAEMRLKDSETKLARIRAQKIADQNQTNADQADAVQTNEANTDAGSGAGLLVDGADQTATTELIGSNGGTELDPNEDFSRNRHQAKDKPRLVIPDVMPVMQFRRSRSSAQPRRLRIEKPNTENKVQGTKRKLEKEHKALTPLVRKSSSPGSVNCRASKLILSQHKRKVRTLALCPDNDQLFVTSALDGVVNLWEVQPGGSDASLLSITDCVSPMKRRWPEDIAWHPDGNCLFSVHSADGQDAQVSIMNLITGKGGKREIQVNFLEDRPHVRGAINNIAFLPWEDTTFVTAGTDHAVILWRADGDNKWTPEPLHRNHHTSAVMGVCGVQQKQIVLSVGKDKRVLGYNADAGRRDFTHQVDARCLGILPNPCDFNLFVVQTGTPERQLRLFDIRSRRKEIHDFGWKQESSETQSALINPAWSPNGLYITSGSADPVIHIFDIRYNGHKPSQSIEAHQKRVFKAAWLHSLPLLISISSDLNLGLHMLR